ncbi:hypothetical protein GBAR_LOCUS23295 [Geodia barretti]|uniref:Uncharacterized protein n=1 Tax=Geodia barretti TaxID=519541 RepID=A0AA35X717_GEOBA|nr:hypothetical protein GBAR_LOCUS23295 [Geodia barretti]
MKTPSIETWKNEYSDKDYTIEVTTQNLQRFVLKPGCQTLERFRLPISPTSDVSNSNR